MKLQLETVEECADEVIALGAKHHDEVKLVDFQYNPDVVLFEKLEEAGLLFVYTLRDAGVLKAYSVTMIDGSNTYRVQQSRSLLLYVAPDARGFSSLKLIKATEEHARQRGAVMHIWDVPARNDFSLILKRLGYFKSETMFTKVL